MMRIPGVFIVCCLISLASCELTTEEETMIDEFMEELVDCRGMPGAAVVLVRDEEIEYTKGYGYANLEDEEPFTADSRFGVASITKSFTTTLAAKLLAQSDELEWDTFARDILGEDFHYSDGYRSNNTMLRDVVSHQTGIPRFDPYALGSVDTREQIVMERMRFQGELYPVRTDLLYNNNMYNVMSSVLEKTFGTTWEELLIENFFQPLNMTLTTFFNYEDPEYEGFVTPYNYNLTAEDPGQLYPSPMEMYSYLYVHGPSATVVSTANDMGKWMRFVLSQGLTPSGERLINATDITRLWNAESAAPDGGPVRPFAPVTDVVSTCGLGYFNGHYRGYRKEEHSGSLIGYNSEFYLLPDMKTGTLFTTNFGGHTRESLYVNQFLQDILLGKEPVYNASEVCEILGSQKFMTKKAGEELAEKFAPLSERIPSSLVAVLEEYDLFDITKLYFTNFMSPNFNLPQDNYLHLSNIYTRLQNEQNVPSRMIENYYGEYGNYALGNLTISDSDMCENCLFMLYGVNGRYTLYPANNDDTFMGYNIYPFFAFTPVTFSGQDGDGNAMTALPLFFEAALPQVFERDLLLSSAPPPNNEQCIPVDYV